MILTLKSPFSSAHLYSQPQWDEAKNRDTFGRCHTSYGHGHNYVLEVGFIIKNSELATKKDSYQKLLKDLTDRLDHEHLNFEIPEFKSTIPTTENITLYFFKKLTDSLSDKDISFLRLYEMDQLWTEIRL
ncbi:MAG: 6-carboxytetrahydropterin synthase [Bdellovibrio sp.]|nr:6-carboxytetrahydropterin synthase [Bdellovibrio sp.]